MSGAVKVESCEQLEITEDIDNNDGELTEHEQEVEKMYV